MEANAMRNVNLNRQVVKVQVGVNTGCLKVRHRHRKPCHPTSRHPRAVRWVERLCFDFRVNPRQAEQTLWQAVDVTPMGSMQIENRGIDPFDIHIDVRHGSEVVQTVQPRSTFALTARGMVQISVRTSSEIGNNPSFGRLRLLLRIHPK
jgi:hypothetical protein